MFWVVVAFTSLLHTGCNHSHAEGSNQTIAEAEYGGPLVPGSQPVLLNLREDGKVTLGDKVVATLEQERIVAFKKRLEKIKSRSLKDYDQGKDRTLGTMNDIYRVRDSSGEMFEVAVKDGGHNVLLSDHPELSKSVATFLDALHEIASY
jgi:hypothetical protein